ncbi:hypothetical protein [Paenibacillus sp. NPDC057967]|uniref:hypothetical protein n=1 Tax=Paenibacillus sp. NPDC057967 TaxID=3346293 RepID=UPI0036D82D3E
MATIGEPLTSPEVGWKRYEDRYQGIAYKGIWRPENFAGLSSGTQMVCDSEGGSVWFKFKGTSIRIVSALWSDGDDNTEIAIDGVPATYTNFGNNVLQCLVYEKVGLDDKVHDVRITNRTNKLRIDAIDINDGGEILSNPDVFHPSPSPSWRRYDADSPLVFRSGTWVVANDAGAQYFIGGSLYFTKENGAYYEFLFKGTKLKLITETYSKNDGAVRVQVDDDTYTVSQKSDDGIVRALQTIFEIDGLEEKTHFVRITKTSGDHMYLDAIDIDETGSIIPSIGSPLPEPEDGWKRIDDNDIAITYTGTWVSESHAAYNKGSAKYSSTPNGKVAFKFTGTRMRIISPIWTNKITNMEIRIDGVTEYFSQNSSANFRVALVYEKLGLSDGEHTVEILLPSSIPNGYNFQIDAVDIDAEGYLREWVTVGSSLTEPEDGWRRYDDKAPVLNYIGTWVNDTTAGLYENTGTYSTDLDAKLIFKFKGTKIRLIGYLLTNKTTSGRIKIDGVTETFSEYGSAQAQVVVYEKYGLRDGEHLVEISFGNAQLFIDAIDIDSDGQLMSRDILGQVLPTPDAGWVRYDADNCTARRGTWALTNNTATRFFTNGSVYYTTTNRNYMVFKFVGSKFRLIAETHSAYDKNVEIRIDGDIVENFSINYGKDYQSFSLVYEKTGLDFTEHTVMIFKTSGTHMHIDAIDLEEAGTMLPIPIRVIGDVLTSPQDDWQRVDSLNPYLSYRGAGWTTVKNANYYSGSHRRSSNANLTDTLNFVFKGTKLRLISTCVATSSNDIQITIDGETEYLTQAFITSYQVLVYEKTGLDDTEHTVEIKKLANGRNNPDFTFEAIDIDSEGYFKAIVGSMLTVPEDGWRRYDDTDPAIKYVNMTYGSNVSYYNGGRTQSLTVGSGFNFDFVGSSFRLMGAIGFAQDSTSVDVFIDDIKVHTIDLTFTLAQVYQAFLFEKVNMPYGKYTVRVVNNQAKSFVLDAIDIDDKGYLDATTNYPRTGGVLRYSIAEMKVGDFIPCGYRAMSANTAGAFYRLGSDDVETEIPIETPVVPYGFFYFIKVAEGVLVADRPIQHGISWLNLNASNYVHGTMFTANDNPVMVSNIHPYGKASASSITNANVDAYFAFNGKDDGNGWMTQNGQRTGWLEYEFPKPIKIQKYSLRAPTSNNTIMPREWTFEAWDGSGWVVLDSNSYAGWKPTEEREYVFLNNTEYKRYRINILSNDGHNSNTGINELKMYREPARMWLRLMNGGRAYIDKNGHPTNKDAGLGIFPSNNEWDKYLGKSEFNRPDTDDGETVWRFNSIDAEWTQDTVQTGFTSGGGFESSGSGRTTRGKGIYDNKYWSTLGTNTTSSKVGYRPIVEYYFD